MKAFNIIKQVFAATLLCVLVACEEIPSFVEQMDPPVITSISPTSGYVSDDIIISGQNLQKIDSVWIGGGLARIRYKLSDEKMVATVSNVSKTGVIRISGRNGEAESTQAFTYLFAIPEIQSYPTEGEIGFEVEITGNFIDYISKVLIGVNRKEAPIVFQSRRDMRVIVPVETDLTEVPMVFVYKDENGEREIVSSSDFRIIARMPILDNGDEITAITAGRTLTLEGTNMRNIQRVFLEVDEDTRIYARVFSASSAKTSFNFEPRRMKEMSSITGTLKYQYYGTVEETINENFVLSQINPADASYLWEDVVLSYRNIRQHASFFSCDLGALFFGVDLVQQNSTGSFINPEGLNNQRAMDLLFYVNNSGAGAFYGPHATTSVFRNFQYVDPTGTDTKAAEYTFTNPKLGVDYENIKNDTVLFRVLSTANSAQTALMYRVLNGEITADTKIDDSLFSAITSQPTGNSVGTASGTPVVENAVIWMKRKKDGKNGLIRVKRIQDYPTLNSNSYIIFDVHWQK
ncbi:MAG: IPT/TIG domain-containing protein [Dysgonamonadaceae bacterium]|jgi:hypothetical protein|nr:IPT/TIG domain-containing protein [Dysgonamonadaceae bacterium]